jgi:membrane fusion protein, heavy metal efflux system
MTPKSSGSFWTRRKLMLVVPFAVIAVALLCVEARTLMGQRAAANPVSAEPKAKPVELIRDAEGNAGIRISEEARRTFGISPVAVKVPDTARPMPPQMGVVNYDNDRLFAVRPRFAGELTEIRHVPDSTVSLSSSATRPLRFGDSVKQGENLAVLWCRDLGEKKAALVDAITSYRLSKDTVDRQKVLFEGAAMSLANFKASERQLQADSNAMLTAERTLKMWKLSDTEIQAIKDEANIVHDQKKTRDPNLEKLWARVEVTAPKFCEDPNRELVVLEKNTNMNDFVDPGRDTPLFRLADLSRLQIWVHPPEEYLPLLRDVLKKQGAGALKWQIRFQADPIDSQPLELTVSHISPSLEPNQHTPMLIGYLDNPDRKFLIGQFVSATLFVPPPPDTVEIPTDAMNSVEGQDLVFVADPQAPDRFFVRRVAVVQRFRKATLVRTKLRPEDIEASQNEIARGRLPFGPLAADAKLMNRGVIELMSAMDDLVGSEPKKQD